MASKDLNIIQRGITDGFRWSAARGRITAEDLGVIGETKTDNSGAMNALPTPFARFFVFREAFRRALEEKNNPGEVKKQAGRAYSQLVSDTLDVIELLYNLKWHENQWQSSGKKIVIREWNASENLKVLKENARILGNSVESYLKDDLGTERLFFVILQDKGKEFLLGTSSPMTGFITPPDLDLVRKKGTQNEFRFVGEQYAQLDSSPLKRRYGGHYFKDCVLLDRRNKDFKNYIYNLFSESSGIDEKFRELRNYVRAFGNDPEIVGSWSGEGRKQLKSENNNPLEVNGLQFYYADVINYLSNTLVKLPYELNNGSFTSFGKEILRSGEHRYFLPLTPEGLEGLTPGEFSFSCKESTTAVDVELKSGGRTYDSKRYYFDAGNEARVTDLSSCGLNLALAIFPNVLSPIPDQNNWFKIMAAISDLNKNRSASVNDLSLRFYNITREGRYCEIPEAGEDDDNKYGTKTPVVRSEQGGDIKCGTKFYEVFDTRFDAVNVNLSIDGEDVSFFIFPKWEESRKTDKAFTYAIDLGTSNTYISRREKGTSNQPQQLKMDKPVVAYLHTPGAVPARSLLDNIEYAYPEEFSRQIKAEFIPPFIDGVRYRFPIRTVLCTKKDVREKKLFDNSDIAFFYERMKCPENQMIDSNVKWASDKQSLRVFIQEILLLIKADILQENGSIQDTEIIWFRPLSFKDELKRNFEEIWKEESKKILCLTASEDQIKCYTESVAPFYYFDNRGDFKNRSSVAVIDIGGGTEDVVYYSNGRPKIANSVRFGCDVLWGEGYNRMKNSRENGIFLRYRDKFEFPQAQKEIYESMIAPESGASSRDIINFWISNGKGLDIPSKFHRDFLPVFAYHLVASLYYTMSLFKVNGFDYPKTLIFSGNGSRYIDGYITADKSVLARIAGTVIDGVYGVKGAEVEIILPQERKEITCYGGLWYKKDYKDPEPVFYAGDGCRGEYKDVDELKKKYRDGMKEKIVSEVAKMNGILRDVLGYLIRKEVAGSPVELDEISKTINGGLDASLETNFQKNVEEQYKGSEQFKDTLFFYPVVQGIFELTKLLKDTKN